MLTLPWKCLLTLFRHLRLILVILCTATWHWSLVVHPDLGPVTTPASARPVRVRLIIAHPCRASHRAVIGIQWNVYCATRVTTYTNVNNSSQSQWMTDWTSFVLTVYALTVNFLATDLVIVENDVSAMFLDASENMISCYMRFKSLFLTIVKHTLLALEVAMWHLRSTMLVPAARMAVQSAVQLLMLLRALTHICLWLRFWWMAGIWYLLF